MAGTLFNILKPGDVVGVYEKNDYNSTNHNQILIYYTVEELYPYFALCSRTLDNGAKLRRGITFGELLTRGYEQQSDELEALRMAEFGHTGDRRFFEREDLTWAR